MDNDFSQNTSLRCPPGPPISDQNPSLLDLSKHYEKDVFLHISDIGEPFYIHTNAVRDDLKKGSFLVVRTKSEIHPPLPPLPVVVQLPLFGGGKFFLLRTS